MLDPSLGTTIGEETQIEGLKQSGLLSTSTCRREGKKADGTRKGKRELGISIYLSGLSGGDLGAFERIWENGGVSGDEWVITTQTVS